MTEKRIPTSQATQADGITGRPRKPRKTYETDMNIGHRAEAAEVIAIHFYSKRSIYSVTRDASMTYEVAGQSYEGLKFEPISSKKAHELLRRFGETALQVCSPEHNAVRRAAWDEWRRIKSELGERKFFEVWDALVLDRKSESALSADLRKTAVSIARNPGMLFSIAATSTLKAKLDVAVRYASTVPGADVVAPSTHARYLRAFGKAVFPYWYTKDWEAWRASTRRNMLSALRYCLRLRILSLTRDVPPSGMVGMDPMLSAEIAELRLGRLLLELSWLEVWAMRIGDERKPRHNRKHDLEGLPENWVDIVFLSISTRAKWRLSAAVMAVFGARPSELAKGVRLELNGPDQTITATIMGSKVTEENGHRERSVTLGFNDSNAMIALIAACRTGGGQTFVRPPNLKNFTSGLNGRIKAVFPDRNLSLYHFRHQFASNAKASGASGATIAWAMGHRSTRTQGGYGSKSTGRTPTENLKAEGSEPLRDKMRQKPWDLRKQQEVEKSPPGPDDLSNMPKP